MKIRASILVLALAACTPPPPPRPLPPPLPPPVMMSPEDAERNAEMEARRSWEEATALGRQGRWTEAEARLRRAVQQRPSESRYHLALSNALVQQGRESEAADALWAGIRAQEAVQSPNHRVLVVDYERLIELLNRVGRSGDAQQARARQAEHRRLRDAGI
ncbi:MAG TPA: tetratricopeptide repeat protein [Longimicrobium sp.]|jgi:thioredoxin-like negative regulator of GroEL